MGCGRELDRIDSWSGDLNCPTMIVVVGPPGSGKTTLAREARTRAIAHGIEVVSADGPPDGAVVVVDDIHLLDSDQVRALRETALRTPVLVTLLSALAADEPFATLWRDPNAERLDLDPLADTSVARLIAQVAGMPFDTASAQRVISLSAGNPRLVCDLVASAIETHSVAELEGSMTWLGPLQITPRLRDSVVRDLVGPRASELAEYVAVGGSLDLGRAAMLVGFDVAECAERTGLMRVEVDGLRQELVFKQPIVAEVVRSGMGRLGLARRAAELLDVSLPSRRPGDTARRAVWSVYAGREGDIGSIVAAARASREQGDLVTAEALARVGAATRDAGAILELGDCLYWQGRFREVLDLFDEHTLSGAKPAHVAQRARVVSATWFWGLDRFDVAAATLDHALVDLGDHPSSASVYGHRAELRMFAAEFTEAIADADRVFTADHADVPARLSAFSGLVPALALTGRVDAAISRAPEGISLMLDQPGRELEGAGALVGMCLSWMFTGRFDELESLVQPFYVEALARSDDPLCGTWAVLLGRATLGRGDLGAAARSLSEATTLLARSDPGRMLVWCASLLCQVHAQRGDVAAATSALDLAERSSIVGIRCFESDLQLARAWCAAASGARERARSVALTAAEQSFDRAAWGVGALALYEAARFGARTNRLWSRVTPLVEGPLFEAIAAHACAPDDPARHFETATALASLGLNLWAAEAFAGSARRAARCGDTMAMRLAQNRCFELLARCGGACTPALVDVDALELTADLSEREREVAQLAVRGLANRAIAEELGLSTRTVENHLARALNKLGLHRRRELVGFFGPVPESSESSESPESSD